jgi:hypothetical protein
MAEIEKQRNARIAVIAGESLRQFKKPTGLERVAPADSVMSVLDTLQLGCWRQETAGFRRGEDGPKEVVELVMQALNCASRMRCKSAVTSANAGNERSEGRKVAVA